MKPVHPHACGADGVGAFPCLLKFGSSPRVWGRLTVPTFHSFILRFIPTRVGQTCTASASPALSGGSSPRVWGRLRGHFAADDTDRFIPTRVGQTTDLSA